MSDLVPIVGSWVCRRDQPHQIGMVEASRVRDGKAEIDVDFGPAGKARLREDEWGCGLQIGNCVQDVPLSGVRETLGSGTVLQVREIATRFQALVQLHASGAAVWFPFERLRRIMGPALLFRRRGPIEENGAERVALHVIAEALSKWNEATGALARLDIDPLPHQISLVHRILSSGQTNWLIADDVGLGKTIEVGLILAALERRERTRRVLLVVPSSLTQQWKEEMLFKFDRRFRIYGADFNVSDPGEWGLYEKVIVSLDLAKPRTTDDDGTDLNSSFGMLLAAGFWDVIVFDEAHRLSRDERGRSTLRFRLAQALRHKTDALLLLTGTPHQGDQGKFRNLLKLVRPDLVDAIELIDSEPDIVQEIVLRNRKIDAVDLNGNFLFKGLLVRRVEILTDPNFLALETELQTYLRRGYGAGEVLGGSEGRAVGFVMTIYRKLASSSVAALWMALTKRLGRISSGTQTADSIVAGAEEDEVDDALADKGEGSSAAPFFEGEADALIELITKAKECMRSDQKGAKLAELIDELVLGKNEKVLIFTEYRVTQAYLIIKIRAIIGRDPEIIHGGQTVDEKRAAVKAFENDSPVLISTEAGGEGLNLHKQCHVMINYDLPWNPSRISQRIGRLYRYGQAQQVVVINFHARDTIDNQIVSILLDRLDTIVREMASVGPEFNSLYAADVMGELLERIDISVLLEEASCGRVDRTQERIDAALDEARRAKNIQDDILNHAGRGGGDDLNLMETYTTADLATFLKRTAPLLKIGVEFSKEDGERFTLRLPPELKGKFTEFGGKTVVLVSTSREKWQADKEVLLDFSTSFVNWVAKEVSAEQFGGGYAAMVGGEPYGYFAAFLARYQNDQGRVQSEKLIVVKENDAGEVIIDNSVIRKLLADVARDAIPASTDAAERNRLLEAARDRAEVKMAEELTRFKHPNDLVLLAVAELSDSLRV
jgi:superfamily II DNA or RNA helicase